MAIAVKPRITTGCKRMTSANNLISVTSIFRPNNGSGFEGLADNTVWWNLSTSVALLAGRYSVLIIPILIAVSLATKPKADETKGSLQIESPTFALTLIGIVLILTLLQFMPVLVIGPIADYLSVKI